jgi:hypothetical protein
VLLYSGLIIESKENRDESEPSVHGSEGVAREIGEGIYGVRGVKEMISAREGSSINRAGIILNHLPVQDANTFLSMSTIRLRGLKSGISTWIVNTLISFTWNDRQVWHHSDMLLRDP